MKYILLFFVIINLVSCSNDTLYLKKKYLKKEVYSLLNKDEIYTVKLISRDLSITSD